MGLTPQERAFFKLAQLQLATSDFDAEHPVCIWIINKNKLPYREAVWLSVLYMAFYDEASAWATFSETDPFSMPPADLLTLPIGKNRRNLWGGRIARHFSELQRAASVSKDWPQHNFTGNSEKDWSILYNNLKSVWGNGRFGAYTTAEMLHKVNRFPVTITGFSNKDSSGPADGIQRLYGCQTDTRTLDAYGERAYRFLLKTELEPTYAQLDRGVTESVLCNYSGVCRGVFYPGRNLDRQQARIMRVEELGYDLGILWDARKGSLRHSDLGELQGWVGIDKSRLKLFKESGELPWVYENRNKS